jgi:hypothetical protein
VAVLTPENRESNKESNRLEGNTIIVRKEREGEDKKPFFKAESWE